MRALTTLVREALSPLARGTTVLVATSGGPDSMALVSLVARVAPALELVVRAHGVDHGLRPEAGAELDLAARVAASLGVAFSRTKVDVPAGGNLQERARRARWRALAEVARAERAVVATAHHADDRAETVLVRLLRGAGVRGLGVLPARARAPEADDVEVVRPLIAARRADLLAHLGHRSIPYATDPSNEDRRFVRARVRVELLPLLETFDPNVVRHLNTLADDALALRDGTDAAWTLPRATQNALTKLAKERSPTARVWLPGGLVAQVETTSEPGKPLRRARKRRGDSTS